MVPDLHNHLPKLDEADLQLIHLTSTSHTGAPCNGPEVISCALGKVNWELIENHSNITLPTGDMLYFSSMSESTRILGRWKAPSNKSTFLSPLLLSSALVPHINSACGLLCFKCPSRSSTASRVLRKGQIGLMLFLQIQIFLCWAENAVIINR